MWNYKQERKIRLDQWIKEEKNKRKKKKQQQQKQNQRQTTCMQKLLAQGEASSKLASFSQLYPAGLIDVFYLPLTSLSCILSSLHCFT